MQISYLIRIEQLYARKSGSGKQDSLLGALTGKNHRNAMLLNSNWLGR